jgi:HD-like signal output (HDOD) protein
MGTERQDLSPPEAAGASDPVRGQFRALFRGVAQKCDLPPFPRVAARALALARDPKARTDDVARVVAADPALAARVLRISNSVVYMKHDPPRTVRDAIVTVGFNTLRTILIAASARSMYRADEPIAERLWSHALATALAADELRDPREPAGGTAFIAGLLHDVGKLVFHVTDPARFARLGYADEERERELFGVTHPVVGGVLADMWSVPHGVADAIMEHHIRPACRLTGRIATADWIAHTIGFGSVSEDIPPPETIEDSTVDLAAVSRKVAQAFAAERAFFD